MTASDTAVLAITMALLALGVLGVSLAQRDEIKQLRADVERNTEVLEVLQDHLGIIIDE